MSETTTTFPIDWNQWRGQWGTWRQEHPALRAWNTYTEGRAPFEGRNFMADEILGVFVTPAGRVAELSEVTFPDLTKPAWSCARRRYVGITWDRSGGSDTGLAESWADLERQLGL